ncbi:hypothetical protein AB0B50_16325 [Streptomyces sp. NPDC041068]|uniref:hypothetical protein n=1 Tax=Streptomyces sp. NPDC041068 TaxID=3155130 RepID=UPI0033D1DC36
MTVIQDLSADRSRHALLGRDDVFAALDRQAIQRRIDEIRTAAAHARSVRGEYASLSSLTEEGGA